MAWKNNRRGSRKGKKRNRKLGRLMANLKQTREYLKHQCKCKYCRKIDAYTLNGHTLCADCLEKEAKSARKRRSRNPYKYRDAQKKIRDERRGEGKCTRCGIVLPDLYSFVTCPTCRMETRNRLRNIRADTDKNIRGQNGICYQCNKNVAIEGKKLCEDCYFMKMMYLEKAMEANRRKKEN